MGVINRVPDGFLDLVDSQTQGRTPPAFIDAVAPTLDMGELYRAQLLANLTLNVNHTGVGNTFQFIVPNNEVWALVAAAVNLPGVSSAVSEAWEGAIGRFPRILTGGDDPTPAFTFFRTPIMGVTTTGSDESHVEFLPRPLYLPAGATIVFSLRERDGGGIRLSTLNLLAHVFKT